MTDGTMMQLLGGVAVTAVTLVVTSTLGRALLRWIDLRRPSTSIDESRLLDALSDVRDRLAQLERTVEASAVELERIGEADRYIAKLVAERMPPAVPAPRAERVITPH